MTHPIRAVPFVLSAAFAAVAAAQKHPLYDDKGTLPWQTTFAAAKEAARKADKLIFVEVGTKT
jgi:hypothetical protein